MKPALSIIFGRNLKKHYQIINEKNIKSPNHKKKNGRPTSHNHNI
jgi:hypothetical protein